MVIIHLQHPPGLRVEIRLGLVDAQMQKLITQAEDMQGGQGDGVISRLLIDFWVC